ncbi:hypothetical protein LINPERPRIM_LOCUS38917 [Linum perenne]
MGRAAFFSAGSMRGTGDIGGFTLLVELWALERFPRIAERYIHLRWMEIYYGGPLHHCCA